MDPSNVLKKLFKNKISFIAECDNNCYRYVYNSKDDFFIILTNFAALWELFRSYDLTYLLRMVADEKSIKQISIKCYKR
jgi:hypothetical protein